MSFKDFMTGPQPRVVPAELLRPSFYGMLMTYYFSIALYGATAGVFGIQTLSITNGNHYTFIWSLLVSVCGLIAGVGVWLSRRFKKEWIEVFATSLLVGLLGGYAVSLCIRGIIIGNIGVLPSTWLPIIIGLLPVWRLAMIAFEGNLLKKNRTAHKG